LKHDDASGDRRPLVVSAFFALYHEKYTIFALNQKANSKTSSGFLSESLRHIIDAGTLSIAHSKNKISQILY
jgi:hypothetical protein